jgi:hypothetical protein
MEIKDKKINEILKKAEDYRKDLHQEMNTDFGDIEEIFKAFGKKDLTETDINDKNNIFLKCKISKEESVNGCNKEIEYKVIEQNGEKRKNKIKVNIPKNIQDESNIILRGAGNYIKNQDKRSNLVIKVKIK